MGAIQVVLNVKTAVSHLCFLKNRLWNKHIKFIALILITVIAATMAVETDIERRFAPTVETTPSDPENPQEKLPFPLPLFRWLSPL